MYSLLVGLMFLVGLIELGYSITGAQGCHSRACLQMLEEQKRNVLKIDWKPISVWLEEAKRFGR